MFRVAAVVLFGLACFSAQAADIKIVDITARLYDEANGAFSPPLADNEAPANLARGDGPTGALASAVLIEFTFSGDKNSRPKFANATVDVRQTDRTGQTIVTHKSFANFVFGAEGVQHKAFLLEGATCMPLQIEVHANRTQKTLHLPFSCKADATPARG